MSVREIQVQRVTVISSHPFDEVVARIDAQIGHTDHYGCCEIAAVSEADSSQRVACNEAA